MSALDNINYMTKVNRHSCANGGPVLMVQTAFRASFPLLLVPWTFSCTDWIKSSVGISWKCGRKLKAVAKHVYGPAFTDGIHHLYSLGPAQVETALWYWFLADLGTGFFADWETLMYQELGCKLPGAGHLQAALQTGVHTPPTTREVDIQSVQITKCGGFYGNQIRVPPGCVAEISYVLDVHSYQPEIWGEAVYSAWIQDGKGTRYSVMDRDMNDPKQRGGVGGMAEIKHPSDFLDTYYTIMIDNPSGIAVVEPTSYVHVTFSGRPMPLIPAGCFTPHEHRGFEGSIMDNDTGPFYQPPLPVLPFEPPPRPHKPRVSGGSKPKPKHKPKPKPHHP